MLYALLALILAAVLFWHIIDKTFSRSGFASGLASVISLFGLIGVAICALWFAFCAPLYIGAGYKATIINKAYGTTYTQEEIFFAGDVIEEIRQLQRKRIELNGDLLRDEGNKR